MNDHDRQYEQANLFDPERIEEKVPEEITGTDGEIPKPAIAARVAADDSGSPPSESWKEKWADLEKRFHQEKGGKGKQVRRRIHPVLNDALELMAEELGTKPNAVLECCILEYRKAHFDSSRNMVEDLRFSLDSLWFSLDQLGAEVAALSDVAIAALMAEAAGDSNAYEDQ